MKQIIENKNVSIFYKVQNIKEVPVIILNNYNDSGQKIFNECINEGCNNFVLVSISNISWNDEMTPYPLNDVLKKGDNYKGIADNYLKLLEDKIIPYVKNYVINELNLKIKYFVIAGYSLGGLFAFYSLFKTDLFKKGICASSSFWYPNFLDFVSNNEINKNVKQIYFSLGNKEDKTRNKVLKCVKENTLKLYNLCKEKNIKVTYEENEGNHFSEPEKRMAKAVKWILR